MWQWRRSWFQRPRWWVRYLLTTASTFVMLQVPAWLGGPVASIAYAAFLSAVLSVGPTWRAQRDHRAWEQLEMSRATPRAQLEAAEAVVRYPRPPTSSVMLADAVRIGELALSERGSCARGSLLASVLFVAAGVLTVVTPWLWVAVFVGATGLTVGVGAVRDGALARRVGELRAQLTGVQGIGSTAEPGLAREEWE